MQECAVHFCRSVSGSEPLDILCGRKGGELCQSGIHNRIYRRLMIPISLRSFLSDPFGIAKREGEGKTDRSFKSYSYCTHTLELHAGVLSSSFFQMMISFHLFTCSFQDRIVVDYGIHSLSRNPLGPQGSRLHVHSTCSQSTLCFCLSPTRYDNCHVALSCSPSCKL